MTLGNFADSRLSETILPERDSSSLKSSPSPGRRFEQKSLGELLLFSLGQKYQLSPLFTHTWQHTQPKIHLSTISMRTQLSTPNFIRIRNKILTLIIIKRKKNTLQKKSTLIWMYMYTPILLFIYSFLFLFLILSCFLFIYFIYFILLYFICIFMLFLFLLYFILFYFYFILF